MAILLVVFYHNFGFTDYFFFGWLGVDLFFVLSGFLITEILINTVNRPGYLKNFYAKRVLRIFPLYYLSLVLFLLILPKLVSPSSQFSYYTTNQWWFWTYLQNWCLIFNDPGHSSTALQHFWSLAVEEQYYLVWPLVILLVKKPRILLALAGVILLGIIITRFFVWTMNLKELNYFGLYTYTRIDGICIGSMLALFRFNQSKFLDKYFTIVVLGLAGINFLFYFFNAYRQFSFPYLAIVGYTTFAIMFALLIHEAIAGSNKLINFIFTNRLLRFFGKISYGFYIFHWPVYLICYDQVNLLISDLIQLPENSSAILVSVLLSLAGLGLSVLSYYGFEKHFLKMKKAFN